MARTWYLPIIYIYDILVHITALDRPIMKMVKQSTDNICVNNYITIINIYT